MVRKSILGFCAVAALAASGTVRAGAPEARNPFHCSIALQMAYELAKDARGKDGALTAELHSRLVWQALAAARFPKALDADAEADMLRLQFATDREGALALAEACMKRQDAHPGFRAGRLEKQMRDGTAAELISARANAEQLRVVMLSQKEAAPRN